MEPKTIKIALEINILPSILLNDRAKGNTTEICPYKSALHRFYYLTKEMCWPLTTV